MTESEIDRAVDAFAMDVKRAFRRLERLRAGDQEIPPADEPFPIAEVIPPEATVGALLVKLHHRTEQKRLEERT